MPIPDRFSPAVIQGVPEAGPAAVPRTNAGQLAAAAANQPLIDIPIPPGQNVLVMIEGILSSASGTSANNGLYPFVATVARSEIGSLIDPSANIYGAAGNGPVQLAAASLPDQDTMRLEGTNNDGLEAADFQIVLKQISFQTTVNIPSA